MSEAYSDDDFENYSEDQFEEEEQEQGPPPVNVAPVQQVVTGRPPTPPARETLTDAIYRENTMARRAASPSSRSSSDRPGSARPGSSASRQAEAFHVPNLSELESEAPARRPVLPSREQLQSDAQKQATARSRARQRAVMGRVTLEQYGIDNMYSANPMSLYDLMAMGRGPFAACAVASVQTNEDHRESETQTEEVEHNNERVQVPEDLGISREELEASRTGRRKPAQTLAASTLEAGSERKLSAFIRSVGNLILKVLGEGSQPSGNIDWSAGGEKPPRCALSSGALRLPSDAETAGRSVSAVSYSYDKTPRLLVAMQPATAQEDGNRALEAHGLGARGLLSVWDLRSPQKPTHRLLCEGWPLCCCWSAGEQNEASYLVYAGMREGAVCLWDLRETGPRYPEEQIEGRDVSNWRRPTYSTEHLTAEGASSSSESVVSLAAVPRSRRTGDGRRRKGNHQLISCTQWGSVTVWSVNEMSAADVEGTYEVDFGLRVGGRVRLLKTSAALRLGMDAMRPPHSLRSCPSQRTSEIGLLPRDTNEFVVGADGGRVLLGARYGQAPAPKEFRLHDPGLLRPGSFATACAATASVTTLHFSPFFPEVFAAGYSDGTVALFATHSSLPLRVWEQTVPGEIRRVRWSPGRPAVLFCLDEDGGIHVFDLVSSNPDAPVLHEQLPGGKVTAFEVSFTVAAGDDGNPEDGWVSPGAGQSKPEQDVLDQTFSTGFEDGSVVVHCISHQWGRPADREYMAVSALLRLTESS